MCFPVNIAIFLRTLISKNICELLLLPYCSPWEKCWLLAYFDCVIFKTYPLKEQGWFGNLCWDIIVTAVKVKLMERLGSERYIVKTFTLREKCPNTELFLVRIYLYSDWIWRFTPLRIQQEYKKIRTRNNSVFGHFSHSVRKTYLYQALYFANWL